MTAPVQLGGGAVSTAPRGLPVYAAGAQNNYDSRLCTYNYKSSNTRRIRAALGRAASSNGQAHILCIGDSETDSYVGTGYAQAFMWPVLMRNMLISYGITSAGFGRVKAGGWSPTADARLTTTGSWTRTQSFGWPLATSNTAGGGDTMTLAVPAAQNGTIAEIRYYDQAANINYTVTNSGGATIASGTIAVGNTGTFLVSTFSGLVDVRNITVTTTGQTNIASLGIFNASGLLVTNAAQYGSRAAGAAQSNAWADPAPLFGISWTSPWVPAITSTDLVMCALGVNDLLNGQTPSVVAAAISTLRGYWPNADFGIVAQYQPSAVTNAQWQAYIAALYALADSLNVFIVDLYDRSGGYTTALANNMMGDGTHPNLNAQSDWGRASAFLLAA